MNPYLIKELRQLTRSKVVSGGLVLLLFGQLLAAAIAIPALSKVSTAMSVVPAGAPGGMPPAPPLGLILGGVFGGILGLALCLVLPLLVFGRFVAENPKGRTTVELATAAPPSAAIDGKVQAGLVLAAALVAGSLPFQLLCVALRGVDFVRINVGIDDIDAINNQYGFDFGDKAIAELGRSLKRVYGVTALVGRLSGQQFAIICQMHEVGEDTRLRELAKQAADQVRVIDDVPITLYTSVGSCRYSEVESLEEQAKRAEVRRLADHAEHTSTAARQERASAIFQVYDNLPIAYAVYKVLLDDEGNACDATLFYVNHEFERRSEKTSAEMLGKSTRELFPAMESEWYEKIRRAAFFGEVITDKLFFEPTKCTYYMTVSQVIHSGYCCCTYQKI